MKESDVILAPLSQADEELKYRPAIILREMPIPYGHSGVKPNPLGLGYKFPAKGVFP